ncbi:hemerythrin domain-containing protein [Methylophilus luteus]|uniref:Hemerythrin domain-containing protein n=1 Tax=Methylophilus luteus TaxID=640108 RepID=A0ABW3F442_9PROT
MTTATPAAVKKTSPTKAAPAKATASSRVKHDVIVLLKNDHDEVKKMFKQYDKLAEKGDIKAKVKLSNKICAELIAHSMAEEEVFYPGARSATEDDALINEGIVEHDNAKDLIAQLQAMDPADPMYDAKVTVLGEYITHHVDEEEEEMFPEVRKSKELDLRSLAVTFTARKQEILAQLQGDDGEIAPQQFKKLIGTPAKH